MRGIDLTCPASEARFIRRLDAGKQIYGAGFLISERMAAERMAAERMAAERMAAERMAARQSTTFTLSPREQQIIRELSATPGTTTGKELETCPKKENHKNNHLLL